ncbi:MAG: hypothetical protein Q9163_000675 [Psora crenata]
MSAAPRLTFLYPHLFKTSYSQDVRLAIKCTCANPGYGKRATFSTSKKQSQATYAQRYGSAQEPQLPAPSGSPIPPKKPDEGSLTGAIEKEVKGPAAAKAKPEEKKEEEKKKKNDDASAAETARESEKEPAEKSALEDRGKAIEMALKDPAERVKELVISPPRGSQTAAAAAGSAAKESNPAKPTARILEMPGPTVEKPEEHKAAPHLQTPPYVHHFDTYTLVKDVERGGFTADQSVTIMKAVRSLLELNLQVARENLVSKSDAENETYLFRAACSELRTEILNLRRSTSSKQHTQLSHLQHTHDVLSQRTTAELASLRDELTGMLNDRRMATRANSQVLDSQISELNYKISVALNSDAKTEVEGLRWVLTRRAAMAIAFMAILILGSLRWGSYKIHEREIAARKMAAKAQSDEGNGRPTAFTQPSREAGTQTAGNEAADRDKAENVGYVSLG